MHESHVVVLYNEPVLPRGHPDAESERDVLESIEIVAEILSASGLLVSRLGVGCDLTDLVGGLAQLQPDAVFNLFEGFADRPFTETVVAGVLDWLGVAYTGSPGESLAVCRDKSRTKILLQGAGLPTAPFLTVDCLPGPKWELAWPAIVKPADQDASVGV